MLNISPIKFVSINNIKNINPQKQIRLKSDTFVRSSNNISFKGSESTTNNGFIQWAQETDFIKTQLPEILTNPDCKLGSGFSHSAYIIPGNEDYILRTSNMKCQRNYDFEKAQIKDTEDKNLNVNIGQEVANIELQAEDGFPMRIEVLKKQTGKPIGVPPSQAIYIEDTGMLREGEMPYEAIERKEQYASTIHKTAQLPVSAYEKLIEDIRAAEKAGYHFDHLNSNNLLINEEHGSINLIDMDKNKVPANLGNVLYALTNINYFSTFASQYDQCPMGNEEIGRAIQDTMEITDKFIQAMKNKGEKFNKEECSYEFFNFINSMPFSFYCKTADDRAKWQFMEAQGIV